MQKDKTTNEIYTPRHQVSSECTVAISSHMKPCQPLWNPFTIFIFIYLFDGSLSIWMHKPNMDSVHK